MSGNEKERVMSMPVCDKSVPYGDDEAILRAFEQDGYCVVTGILSEDQVHDMMEELWTSDRLLGKFDRNDPTTWGDPSWPQQNGGKNFLQSQNVFQDAVSWDLEGNEKLLHVQKLLFGRSDLMMASLGRFGVMRPTQDHPEWRTATSWLHWDQNPHTQPGFFRIQCIVCLTDNNATSGGFACVPGFHREEFQEWGKRHPLGSVVVNGKVMDATYGTGQPYPVPADDPCQDQLVHIVAPAGSVVLWDSRLPHQNFPNTDATAFRVVHYTMMRIYEPQVARDRRRMLEQKRIIMDLLGQEGLRFPHSLSNTARIVNCLDETPLTLAEALQEFGVPDTDKLREAAKLVREAGELEEKGETYEAIKRHQRSMRIFPDIEEWHEAIF